MFTQKTTSKLVLISASLEKRRVAPAAVLFIDQIVFLATQTIIV